MSDLIKREDAMAIAFKSPFFSNALMEEFKTIPTIDAVEVVRGEWIDKPTKGVRYICSRCRGRFDYQWKYCPNCGARMKGADDDTSVRP